MTWLLTALAIGACAGLLGALCGVGGGIVMVPAFVMLLGLSQKHAVATSLAVIVPMAVVSSLRYAQSGLIDWRIAAAAATGSIITAYFGTEVMKSMSNLALTRLFGAVVILFGIKMLFFTKA